MGIFSEFLLIPLVVYDEVDEKEIKSTFYLLSLGILLLSFLRREKLISAFNHSDFPSYPPFFHHLLFHSSHAHTSFT